MSALLGYILGEWIFVVNHRLHQQASIGHLIWEQKARAEFKRTVPTTFRTGQAMRVKED